MGWLDRLRGDKPPTTRVLMLVSTATEDHDLVAGNEYKLPVEMADVFIAKKYATGNLSREIPEDELADLTALDQRTDV